MAVTYHNRKGQTYYLHVGKTPKRAPKYFFSRKSEGNLVDEIPSGYEIYESPDRAQVYLRKPKPTPITPAEREFVLQECRRLTETDAVLVDVSGDSIIIYFAEGDDRLMSLLFDDLGLPSRGIAAMQQWRATHGHYHKLLRFTLVDEDRRLFSAERWCFRGSIDNWFPLTFSTPPVAPLDDLVHALAPHLGRESFYELM